MPTKGKIKRALEGLSSGLAGLHDVYELAMVRIESQSRESSELAKSVLSWIVHARTPLSVMQLQHALSVTPNAKAIDEDDIPTLKTLQSVCGGLVAIDMASNKIRLIHYTTQEYFERTRGKWFPDAQRQITQTCVIYLSFPIFSKDCSGYVEPNQRQATHSFYDYAHSQWVYHAKESPAVPEVIEFLRKAEREERLYSSGWHKDSHQCKESLQLLSESANKAIHVAIHYGLDYAAEGLLCSHDNLEGYDCESAAIAHAIYHERTPVVKLLLDIEVTDVNYKDRALMTPLGLAAKLGHAKMARLLLGNGRVDINSKNGHFDSTPLALAVGKGHEEVVQLLLQTEGIDANVKDWDGQTPLVWAIMNGKMEALKLLLKVKGIDTNRKNGNSETPIIWAIMNGKTEPLDILLKVKGIDANNEDWDGQTPLVWAIVSGNMEALELLLKTEGIDVNKKDQASERPLGWAIASGNMEALELLLKAEGIDINRKNHAGQTPLALSVKWGNKKATKMLLDTRRLLIDSQDQTDQTPLTLAIQAGDTEVVRMLLESGRADINLQNQVGQTALALAAKNGHKELVKMLLATGKTDEVDCDDLAG